MDTLFEYSSLFTLGCFIVKGILHLYRYKEKD